MKCFFILFLFSSVLARAQNNEVFYNMADEFLQNYVVNGKVKYAQIQQNPKALKDLMAEAKKVKVSAEDELEYKAFWINAYNLAVISGIVDSYPVVSPLKIKGFFDQRQFNLAGKAVTLDEVEKELLFANFPEEERLHLVLVCGAVSCPALLNVAYRPELLEKQLEEQTRTALNNPEFVKVGQKKVLFSEIFKWYKEDFTSGGRSLIQYVNQFRQNKIPEGLESGYYEYNWELNEN